MNQQEYLQNRVYDQVKWLDAKSAFNQKMYKRFQAWRNCCRRSYPVPGWLSRPESRFPICHRFLGVLIVVLKGIEQLYKFHENWLSYRTTNEALKRENVSVRIGHRSIQRHRCFTPYL